MGGSAEGRYISIAEAVREVIGRNEELGERNEEAPKSSGATPWEKHLARR